MSQEDVKPSPSNLGLSSSASGPSAASTNAPSTPSAGLHINTDVGISTSGPSPNLLGPAPLKRNMACLTCRKRKLRCDAAKPVCGTCTKSRLVAIVNNHPPPVPEGECIYGDTKAEDLSPTLQGNAAANAKKAGKRTRDIPLTQMAVGNDGEAVLRAKDQQIAQLEQQLRQLQLAVSNAPTSSTSAPSSAYYEASPTPQIAAAGQSTSAVPGLGPTQLAAASGPSPDPMLELVWSAYPKDLPPPDTVHHLSEIFFASSPYRNVLHKPNFMASLLLPLNHPDRPHAGLLHAILAIAVPLSPFFRPKDDNLDPARKIARIHKRIDLVVGMDTTPPAGAANKRDMGNLSFSEYHLALARQKSEMALLTGSPNPMDWCQALLLVSYQLRVDERALEAYLMAACVAKISTPGGLTRMHAYRREAETFAHAYIAPPSTVLEEHERRSYFWHLYLIEAYTSGGVQFFHSTYDDKAISTTFPIRMDDFQRSLDPTPNAQNLHSLDLYSNLDYDDDFLLHLKSGVLCKRTYMLLTKWKLDPSVDVTQMAEHSAIERDTLTFLRNMPSLDFSVTVQVERLVAVLNVHTIIIHLYQDMKGSHTHRPEVLKRLRQSVALVVQIAHNLNASNFDMGLLHFRTFNGLGVIAKVICHEINDTLSSPLHTHWSQEDSANRSKDSMLIEALQALDAILMVLRRSKDRIPYAGRFEALLSKFRSGGWDNDSIERSMTVYHIYRAQRDLEKDSKPDPNSGKTGDLWTADDRMSDSWRLHTTKYKTSVPRHQTRTEASSSISPVSAPGIPRSESEAILLPSGFERSSIGVHPASQVENPASIHLEPYDATHSMDPYGPGPYYYTPQHPGPYAQQPFSTDLHAPHHEQRHSERNDVVSDAHFPSTQFPPPPLLQPTSQQHPEANARHYGGHVYHEGHPTTTTAESSAAPASAYNADPHWSHHLAAEQRPVAVHHLQNQADLLSRWNFF